MESRMKAIEVRKKGLLKFNKPLKFMAERGRFELPVPFEYTRFPIVLLRPARTPLRGAKRYLAEFRVAGKSFFAKKTLFFLNAAAVFFNILLFH